MKAHKHRWITDGHHMNEFCAVCFEDSPRWKEYIAKHLAKRRPKTRKEE